MRVNVIKLANKLKRKGKNLPFDPNRCWARYQTELMRLDSIEYKKHPISEQFIIEAVVKILERRKRWHERQPGFDVETAVLLVGTERSYIGAAAPLISDRLDRRHQLERRGVNNTNAKLTDASVKAIRAETGSSAVIANKYGITPAAVRNIKARRRWAHLGA